jgi:hypothetical protein
MTTGAPSTVTVVERLIEQVDAVLNSLADLAAQLAALDAGNRLSRTALATLRQSITDVLGRHKQLVTGAGVITAPGLLEDAPYWLEWWWRTTTGTLAALRVNLDPQAPDFFDYALTDWYAIPARTGTASVAGPYVDYVCTNEYTVTLSHPVVVGGQMLGVAAADVLVSSLERFLMPDLLHRPGEVVVTNDNGRIVASNQADKAPGTRLTSDAKWSSRPITLTPTTSWLLHERPLRAVRGR